MALSTNGIPLVQRQKPPLCTPRRVSASTRRVCHYYCGSGVSSAGSAHSAELTLAKDHQDLLLEET